MAGTKNDVLVGKNADFSQADAPNSTTRETNGLVTNGQMWIGTTAVNAGGTHINVGTITSPLGTLSVGYSSPNITLDLAGGSLGIDSIGVDATSGGGTNPVLPTVAGLVTTNGAVVAAGTNPVRTVSTAANVYQVQVQTAQAIAATDATKVGLANFNSAQFSVDANGFVSTSGTGVANTITGTTGGALSPTAGNWNILGASTAAGTTPVNTSGAGSTLTVNVQKAQAIAATDATKVGLANFNSAQFSVDANGFVSASGTGIATTITGDSGGALSPTANNWNILGGTNCTTSGSGSTLTVDVVGVGTTWVEVTGTSVNASVNTGYILNNAALVTVNLPGTCAVGDEIRLAGKGAGLWVVDAPAGDTIHFGNQDTSSGGTITATNRYDCLHLLCTVANSEWTVLNGVGNLTVA